MSRVWCLISVVVFVASSVNGSPKPQETNAPDMAPIAPEILFPPEIPSPPSPPPLENGELAVPDCKNTTDVYDMSQNGSENYKVNVKGFTFLLAGSDTVLGAAMLMSGLADDKNNPAMPAVPGAAPASLASSEKVSRLMSLIKQISHGGRSINVNLVDNQEGDKQSKRYLRNIH